MVKPGLVYFNDVVKFEFNSKIYQGVVEDFDHIELPWDKEGYDEYGIHVDGDDDLFFVTNKAIVEIISKAR